MIEDLSLQCKKKIIWKFSTTCHGVGVADGIGGNVKSILRCQVMSMKKDRPITQDSESSAELTKKLVPSTKIKNFSDEEIVNCKKTNSFRNSVSVNGIFNMHVMTLDRSKIQLWRNSAYHKMRAKSVINIERNKHKHSDNDEMQHSESTMNNLLLCFHDLFKIIKR